jgi:hypothetical protein
MPAYVTGEGEPFRPDILLWVEDGRDLVPVGALLGKPGELLAKACDNLHETIKNPMAGPPRAPKRLRVPSAELADLLRVAHPSIEIVCGPTPELEGIVDAMDQAMGREIEPDQTYLIPGVSPEAVASHFRAAAALYRSRPWKIVPPDQVMSVTVESHGVHQAVLSVIGQLGESLGFLLFHSIADFDAYVEAAEAIERGEKPTLPSYLVLNYLKRAELEPRAREEVSSHGWELVSSRAYPWTVCMDKDSIARPLPAKELALMEGIAAALAKLVAEDNPLGTAFAGGEPCLRTYSVTTHEGELSVAFRVPHEEEPASLDEEDDLLSELYALEEDGDIDEVELRQPLEDELVQEFLASPEGRGASDIEGHRMLMSYAAENLGASIGTLEPWGVREVLFDIIPRKVSIEASAAGAIVEDCRAFYRFLGRAYELEQADECLEILGPGTERKLAMALDDPRNFGMAKSLVMSGKDAGFDMQSKEGIEAWMRSIQGKTLPPSVGLPFDGAPSTHGGGHDADRKKQRKAVRKARRANR